MEVDPLKALRITISILLILVALFALLTAASYLIWHRSAMATLVEQYLWVSGQSGKHASVENAEEHLAVRAEEEKELWELPDLKFKSTVTQPEDRLVVFSGSEETDNSIIYIHGGAYVDEATKYHLEFCDKLARSANATVYFPVYPLAPDATWEDAYPLIERIYIDEMSKCRPVTVMGDSAGGGFSAAFCEYLGQKGLTQPDHLILLSPWLDVSMESSDYASYEKVDPMLAADTLVVFGRSWAGDLDAKDYRVSPMYGDVSAFPETTILVGTREIFYPDVTQFQEKLLDAGVNSTLIVGEGLNHVFPIYPIPEAKDMLTVITDVIRGN